MSISRDDLQKFNRKVPPAPASIEPLLSPVEEAALIMRDKDTDPTVPARRERVLAIIRRAAVPEGADAELLAILAAGGALPIKTDEDRLRASMRLTEIGKAADPPVEVQKIQRQVRVAPGDGQAFAEKLLRASRSFGDLTPNNNISGF